MGFLFYTARRASIMEKNYTNRINAGSFCMGVDLCLLVFSCSSLAKVKEGAETPSDALVIARQGNFSAGGAVIFGDGEFYPNVPWFVPQGGHANVFYQVPAAANAYAMVFLHGYGQVPAKMTNDRRGREGISTIFLRQGYSVYLVV